MATTPVGAQVHTATNDVICGYETMLDRAEPVIERILTEPTEMNRRHAADPSHRLHALGHSGEDDTSIRGAVYTVAVTLRDWVTGLDEGSLGAVKRGGSRPVASRTVSVAMSKRPSDTARLRPANAAATSAGTKAATSQKYSSLRWLGLSEQLSGCC